MFIVSLPPITISTTLIIPITMCYYSEATKWSNHLVRMWYFTLNKVIYVQNNMLNFWTLEQDIIALRNFEQQHALIGMISVSDGLYGSSQILQA